MDNIKIKDGIATLCCGRRKCPTLRIEDGFVFIKDDFGNEVKLEKDQASLISQAIDQLAR